MKTLNIDMDDYPTKRPGLFNYEEFGNLMRNQQELSKKSLDKLQRDLQK